MRKVPRQARSRQMVERIITAGRDVLVADGYDAFSTNRVAARAAVSPGSLYQYFPDKGAILDVVIARYWDEVAELVAASLADRVAETGPTLVRSIADALVAALEADRTLLAVVARELPLQLNGDRLEALERQIRVLTSALLGVRPVGMHRPSPQVASWVVVMAVQNLALRWVLDQPAGITREQLVDEMEALVVGYLAQP
ncbi:TetR/AcrR family transcriptional regulator [Nocardioides alcanivorans]|uniref:TetR/AcrR family transcriptional regulator n=1 Tax=Nocardioides alcanivorans TaxID=2897352 RepID=UPI001F2A6A79|nr:TetR/AcrR family transcriptional regulator [Nocardioides alcanivorans]